MKTLPPLLFAKIASLRVALAPLVFAVLMAPPACSASLPEKVE